MSAATPPTPDGNDWTVEHLSSNGAGADARSETASRLVVLGYITAVAMPLLGLILGIVVATRPQAVSKHGRWIILLSVLAGIVWILVFASGVLTSQGNDMSY